MTQSNKTQSNKTRSNKIRSNKTMPNKIRSNAEDMVRSTMAEFVDKEVIPIATE